MKLAAALFALLLSAPLAAQTSPPLQLPYTQFTLPNGLHVILHEDHSVPLVTVNVWYQQNIEAVTSADVERVARKYIQPDTMAVVVVGDRATIEPRIRALNLGPINIITIGDVFDRPPSQ